MVQTVPGNTWIDGGEENVAVAKTIHYTADEVKAGDYIYSGRSTSDGGLRKRYPNGKAQVIADPKPQSVAKILSLTITRQYAAFISFSCLYYFFNCLTNYRLTTVERTLDIC